MNSMTVGKKISAVILCAGQGTRMGGQLKALLPFQNHTFLDEVLDQIAPLPFEEILLVTGYESHRIREHVVRYQDQRIKLTNNSLYITGLFRSLKSGIKALFKKTDAVMIILVDQPQISTKTYLQVYEEFQKSTEKSLFRVTYQNRAGHPVIIGSKYFQTILSRIPQAEERDRGCQFLFNDNADDVLEIAVQDQHTTNDIDTTVELEKLKSTAQ